MSDFKAKMHQIRFRWGSLQLDSWGLLLTGGRGRREGRYIKESLATSKGGERRGEEGPLVLAYTSLI